MTNRNLFGWLHAKVEVPWAVVMGVVVSSLGTQLNDVFLWMAGMVLCVYGLYVAFTS